MSLSVGNVIKLVRPYGIVQGIRISFSLVVVILRVIERHGGDRSNVGSQHSKEVDLFLTLRIRHVDHTLVPFTPTNVGQTDPRVPCGTFDDGTARLEKTLIFGVFDEEEGGSVFDRSAG